MNRLKTQKCIDGENGYKLDNDFIHICNIIFYRKQNNSTIYIEISKTFTMYESSLLCFQLNILLYNYSCVP